MVSNPPSKAGEAGSIPGGGTKIPHTIGQISLCDSSSESSAPQWMLLGATTKTQCGQINNCLKKIPVREIRP